MVTNNFNDWSSYFSLNVIIRLILVFNVYLLRRSQNFSLDLKNDPISCAFQRLDRDAVRDVNDADVVHLQDDVVHAKTLVDGGSAT